MRKHCGMTHHQSNRYCKVRSLYHRVKCDFSVQRIGTNTNNPTASKHVNIGCQIFCIFRETGTCIFVTEPQRQEYYIEPKNSKEMFQDFAILYWSSSFCIKSFGFSFSCAFFCLSFSFMYSLFTSVCSQPVVYYFPKLKTPEVSACYRTPTTRIAVNVTRHRRNP